MSDLVPAPAPGSHGLMFSGVTVRALLAHQKTETRRLALMQLGPDEPITEAFVAATLLRCTRYGVDQDEIWVRERWRFGSALDKLSPALVAAQALDAGYKKPWAPLRYEADGLELHGHELRDFGGTWGRLRLEMYMPRWMSRILLRRVGPLRIERLSWIDDASARAEGIGTRAEFLNGWDDIHPTVPARVDPVVVVVPFRVERIEVDLV